MCTIIHHPCALTSNNNTTLLRSGAPISRVVNLSQRLLKSTILCSELKAIIKTVNLSIFVTKLTEFEFKEKRN